MTEIDDDELGDALADFAPAEKAGGRSAREQRILTGFEEIERFAERHGRLPQHGEGRDIFERLYAVRLDRLRQSPECRAVLAGADRRGLLGAEPGAAGGPAAGEPDDEALATTLADLVEPEGDVTRMVHVRSPEEIRAAEEIAQRDKCQDFDTFRQLFEQVQRELKDGARQTVKYQQNAEITTGDWFVVEGQKAWVASAGEAFVSHFGRPDRRLRVIYDNGTENALLGRSLMRALYRDPNSRRIVSGGPGPLFSGEMAEGDQASGTIYVLRSRSDHPFIAEHRSLVHKIGVTGGDVDARVANASKDPTYLLADVDVVATFRLANVNRKGLEAVLHKFFAAARLDVELRDRFGSAVEPREWFMVPLTAIDEAIRRVQDGTLSSFWYDPSTARLTDMT